jgi:RNA polymerase sigma-70 factor (ECF subfamily)
MKSRFSLHWGGAFPGGLDMDETRTTLLLRLKDGTDQTAWRTFNQLYRSMLVAYAAARGLDANDAEDVAQQCIQAVLDRIGEYEHLGSFKTWLRAIAEKKVCDRFRAMGREVQVDSAVWAAKVDPQPGPDELWERQWWSSHLRHGAEAIRHEVAETTFAAFIGYAIEGEAPDIVARSLGLSVNQVYVAKHRVLDRLRGLMIEWTGESPVEAYL